MTADAWHGRRQTHTAGVSKFGEHCTSTVYQPELLRPPAGLVPTSTPQLPFPVPDTRKDIVMQPSTDHGPSSGFLVPNPRHPCSHPHPRAPAIPNSSRASTSYNRLRSAPSRPEWQSWADAAGGAGRFLRTDILWPAGPHSRALCVSLFVRGDTVTGLGRRGLEAAACAMPGAWAMGGPAAPLHAAGALSTGTEHSFGSGNQGSTGSWPGVVAAGAPAEWWFGVFGASCSLD